MRPATIELAEIRLAPGRTEADLKAASDRFQDRFLKQQPGFVRRELLRGADGLYYDLIHWDSGQAAAAIMKLAMESPDCMDYFAVMQMDGEVTSGVKHMTSLAAYG